MISKLTDEQEKKIAEYREKWLKNGFRTDPISFETAVSECKWVYNQFLKEYSPEPVVFLVASPLQALIVANAVCNIIEGGSQLDSQLNSQLGSQLGSQLDSQLNSQLYSQLGSQLYSQLNSQLGSQLDSQLNSQLNSQLDSQLYSQLNSQLGSQLYSQLGSQLDTFVRSQLYSQLNSQLGSQLGSQLDSQLNSQLNSQLDSQLNSQLNSQLDSQLYSQLNSQLGSQLGSQLNSQLNSQLDSQLGSQLDSQLNSQLGSQLYSQLDSQLYSQLDSQKLQWKYYTAQAWYWSGYYGFYDYILEVLLPQEKPKFEVFDRWRESLQRINWMIPLTGVCIAVQRPTELHFGEPDTTGLRRLHRDGGMAVRFEDGWGLHALNGIRVPQWAAETPATEITKEQITKETNADIRREVIRKIGSAQLLKVLDYKVIDSMDEYELINFDIGDGRTRPFLKMTCPTTKLTHVEGVMPDIKTVKKALAYKFKVKKWVRPLAEA